MKTRHYAIPNSQNVVRQTLANGITVIVYPVPYVRSVSLVGSFCGGMVFDAPDLPGQAALTASMLMRGTQRQSFDALHTLLEDTGADLGFGASMSSVSFDGKGLAEDLPLLLDLLSECLRLPIFPDDELERLRTQTITALRYAEQDPRSRIGRALRQRIYAPEHPFYRPGAGTLESIPRVTAQQLRDFHALHYGPREMIVTLVGHVDPAQAIEQVRARLEDWQNPAQPARPALPPMHGPQRPGREEIRLPGKTESLLVLGTLGPAEDAADLVAARLANSVLGEFGMMGRLGLRIREDAGLAYYASSHIEVRPGAGLWLIEAGVAPEHVEQTLAMALEEVHRMIEEEISDDDLADNQAQFTGRLPLSLESPGGVAVQLHAMERLNLSMDYLLNFSGIVQALRKADVLAAARRYLKPEQFVTVIAGP